MNTKFNGRVDSHPIHKLIYELCVAVEKLPIASVKETNLVVKITSLHDDLADLLLDIKDGK